MTEDFKKCLPYLQALQPEIRKRLGRPKWLDQVCFPACGQIGIYGAVGPEDKDFIFIPLAIDPENPERGLWGMLEKQGRIDIMYNYCFDEFLELQLPYLALLQALAHQWNVEVKE